MAGSFGAYLENKILDYIFGRTDYEPPLLLYLAASTTDPTNNGSGITEPVGSGYERLEIENTKSSFENAANGQLTNKIEFAFAPATGDWGIITHIAIFDEEEGGNFLGYSELTVPKPINEDILRFSAGNLVINLS